MSMGKLPEVLSQGFLVGRILVGGLGVLEIGETAGWWCKRAAPHEAFQEARANQAPSRSFVLCRETLATDVQCSVHYYFVARRLLASFVNCYHCLHVVH